MEIIGTHVLYGFMFKHDFHTEGPIVGMGQQFTIYQDTIRFKNQPYGVDRRIVELSRKIPLIILPLTDNGDGNGKNSYAIGYQISYFGKNIVLSMGDILTKMGLFDEVEGLDLMRFTLQEIQLHCDLRDSYIDFISVPLSK